MCSGAVVGSESSKRYSVQCARRRGLARGSLTVPSVGAEEGAAAEGPPCGVVGVERTVARGSRGGKEARRGEGGGGGSCTAGRGGGRGRTAGGTAALALTGAAARHLGPRLPYVSRGRHK